MKALQKTVSIYYVVQSKDVVKDEKGKDTIVEGAAKYASNTRSAATSLCDTLTLFGLQAVVIPAKVTFDLN